MELVVVILILGVLAVVFAPRPCGSTDAGNVTVAKDQINQFDHGLTIYRARFREFPDRLDGLVRPPSGVSLMSTDTIPLDPWGNPYVYEVDGLEKYVIKSLGADGAPGGDDVDSDISSDDLSAERPERFEAAERALSVSTLR